MGFHRADRTRLNAFPVGEHYRFRAYFDEPGLFATLAPFYDGSTYRFEVPRERFEAIAEVLRSHGYDPVVVEDPAPFVVAHRRFQDHPKVLFEAAVATRQTDRYTLFMLKDRAAVHEAVDAGAVELEDLDDVTW